MDKQNNPTSLRLRGASQNRGNNQNPTSPSGLRGAGKGKRINLDDQRLRRRNIKTNGKLANTASDKMMHVDDGKNRLRIIPLGGLGEVGKNLTVFEYGNDIIIVDMGFLFPDSEMPGIDYVIPDISYLDDKKDRIRGILITHGHEDHVGAIPYLWPRVSAPIYGTKLTLGLVEGKLEEHKTANLKNHLNVIDPEKDKLKLGVFEIEAFRVAHSIPDAIGYIIKTPVGTIVHTGDFRFDHSPVDNKNTDIAKIAEAGGKGVLLLMSDSTNSESPGYSPSERTLEAGFNNMFENAPGRIIISSFSSQINRIQQVINISNKKGRKLAFAGRSMLKNVEIAVRLGYLKVPTGLIVKIEEINKAQDMNVAIMCTGSQGESMSALARMASGDHKQIKIRKGDTVVFSASPIPGNETNVTTVVDDLFRQGANVVFEASHGSSRMHVSGHPYTEELKMMLTIVKPKYFMPIHGERHHLVHHAQLAEEVGIERERSFILDNGNVLEIDDKGSRLLDRKVQSGMVLIDGLGVGDIGEIVLRDRKAMSTEGIYVVICSVDRNTKKIITSPDIISRGFIYMRENEKLVNDTRGEVRRIMARYEGTKNGDWADAKSKLRDEISRYLFNRTKRQPMVIPVIIEV